MRMKHPQQGTLVDCVYCKYVRPELKGEQCPVCHGRTPEFRPARMMDTPTSQMEILQKIEEIYCHKNELDFKQGLLTLLTHIDLYNFDLKDAIINQIRYLEDFEQ